MDMTIITLHIIYHCQRKGILLINLTYKVLSIINDYHIYSNKYGSVRKKFDF